MSFPFCQIQEDCLWVLSQLQGPWKIPADALYEAIAQQGWQIRLGSLPAELFCACDAWKQTITISLQLQEQLNCPHLHREVLHWLLAVELGNIRLNSMAILEGKQDLACERLATDYASAFLLPEETLRAHPDVAYLLASQPLPRESWQRMCRVAEHFRVPVRCVQVALECYGLLTENSRFRELAA